MKFLPFCCFLGLVLLLSPAHADTSPSSADAQAALDRLNDHIDRKKTLTAEEQRQAAKTIVQAARSLPSTDPVAARVTEFLAQHAAPTARKPLTVTDLDRVLLRVQHDDMRSLPPDQVKPHPTADAFPGAVPPDAPRVSKVVDVTVNVGVWRSRGPYAGSDLPTMHGTGLYAAPGEVVTVELDKDLLSIKPRVRIGCHRDGLWRADKLSRFPEITQSWPLTETATKIASPFGGPVYVEVPHSCEKPNFQVKISGAVEAPQFVLGKTTAEQWRKERDKPAPWAELAGTKMILTVPAASARKVDDPEQLLKEWDRVMDACAELATYPTERFRPERFVADVQISAGYMHSGYPLMAHLDIADVIVDWPEIAKNKHGGIWGFFHEVGHNHQSSDWTFEGTTEVTVNLFTLYVYDKVFDNKKPRAEVLGEARSRKLTRYVEGGAKFTAWKNDPFLALIMYMQLQEAFGWEPFLKVFKEYRELPDAQRPRGDDAKRDQWLVRMSKATGKNLGPFFQAWGVPTSDEARKSVAELPAWMPPDFPRKPE